MLHLLGQSRLMTSRAQVPLPPDIDFIGIDTKHTLPPPVTSRTPPPALSTPPLLHLSAPSLCPASAPSLCPASALSLCSASGPGQLSSASSFAPSSTPHPVGR